ncbi:MAG: hypothetical protein WCJ58_00080 [bacterium]
MKRKIILIFVIIGFLISAIVLFFLTAKCDDYGGYQVDVKSSCTCDGYEWVVYDKTSSDGYRLSYCLGRKQPGIHG